MSPIKTFSLLAVVAVLVIVSASVFTVQQGQNAMVLRLGKIVTLSNSDKPRILGAGLHFKLPFIENVKQFDMRLHTDSVQLPQVYIKNGNYFVVDYYFKWRVVDLPKYYTSTGGIVEQAQKLMTRKIEDSLRVVFGKSTLKEVVTEERVAIMQSLRSEADKNVKNLGIEIVDLRIKAIDLPPEVRQSVFDSMRADRQKVANKFRGEGYSQAEKIRAEAEAERIRIISQAQRDAEKIRAIGISKAAQIYSNAFHNDAEFYSFYRSLTAYKGIFANSNDILVLQPKGDFFKYFNNLKDRTSSKE